MSTPMEQAFAQASEDKSGALFRAHFETAAAKSGLDEDYLDLIADQTRAAFAERGEEPTKEAMVKHLEQLRTSKPKLFAQAASSSNAAAASAPARAPITTAPRVASHAPTAPAPTHIESTYERWRSLRDQGLTAEAEAFYQANRRTIQRGA